MPLYNTQRYLSRAIQGILDQTYTNFELIICDNCSTDQSVAIAEEFARKDARIRLIQNKRNVGYAGNLHKVTSLATGDFMIVHCADDFSHPKALARMLDVATSNGVNKENVIVMSDVNVTNADGNVIHILTQNPKGFESATTPMALYESDGLVRRFSGKAALAYALPRLQIVGWLGATLYSKKLFESIEGVYNGLLYNPDLQLNYHLLSRDPTVLWINEPLFYWRHHETNQESQVKKGAIIKQALDTYTYTFLFSPKFLEELGVKKETIVREFIDAYCIKKALQEINDGSLIFALRHLFFALATYPGVALRNMKFYLALAGILTGPLGRFVGRVGYGLGLMREKPVDLRLQSRIQSDALESTIQSIGAR